MQYNGLKAFYVVSEMIAELEGIIEEKQDYNFKNKGVASLKLIVEENRVAIKALNKELKPLYRIRNALYGV